MNGKNLGLLETSCEVSAHGSKKCYLNLCNVADVFANRPGNATISQMIYLMSIESTLLAHFKIKLRVQTLKTFFGEKIKFISKLI